MHPYIVPLNFWRTNFGAYKLNRTFIHICVSHRRKPELCCHESWNNTTSSMEKPKNANSTSFLIKSKWLMRHLQYWWTILHGKTLVNSTCAWRSNNRVESHSTIHWLVFLRVLLRKLFHSRRIRCAHGKANRRPNKIEIIVNYLFFFSFRPFSLACLLCWLSRPRLYKTDLRENQLFVRPHC